MGPEAGGQDRSHPSQAHTPPMPKLLFDFSDPAAADQWHAIDDRVMGGVSQSRLRPGPAGHAVFEGTVSLDRNGGFASVRSRAGHIGMAGAVVCLIDVCGDNKQFKLGLRTDAAFDSLVYQASFTPVGADWQTLRLPLALFNASSRGRDVPGAPLLDPAQIHQVGLMVAGRQAGPFRLCVRHISLA